MANDFTGMTHYIDTPMIVEAPPFVNCNVYIRSLNWSKMAANDTLTVTDRNGKVIFDVVAPSANLNINLPNIGWQAGYIVTQLGTAGANVQIAVGNH